MLYVLTALVIINIVITIRLSVQIERGSVVTSTDTKTLPLTRDQRDTLFESFQSAYNTGDYKLLHQVLAPATQEGVSLEDMEKTANMWFEYLGTTIKSGAYSHYEYAGLSSGMECFCLHYRARFLQGERQNTGIVSTTIAFSDGEYGVTGITLTGE